MPPADSQEPRRTALAGVHQSLGAHMTDFAGWYMPLRYDSELAEHHAVRTVAGLFDLSHMGEIEIVGTQAAEYLDYALVGSYGAMAPLAAKYTMICQDDGGILDDLIVYRLRADHFLVVANAGNRETVFTALRQRSAGWDDISILDNSDLWSLIAVQGPLALAILNEMADSPLDSLKHYSIAQRSIAGFPVLAARTGYTGEDGFELFCSPADAAQLWTTILEKGKPEGLVPAGLACRDSLRLEAGMPLYGNELSLDLTPFEAGLGRVVALDKSRDSVGGDALRERSQDDVSRVRVGLELEGKRSARTGYAVLTPSGTSVGQVTSGALSPTLGVAVAMAYVDRESASVGTPLLVDVRGVLVPARIVPLPFYKRTNRGAS
ncbi:MAG: glycine cleavage system aminomethyltransferase GcvT [Actinomycetes bacterium]